MSQLNAWLNGLMIGFILLAGAYLATSPDRHDFPNKDRSSPDSAWFQSAVLQRAEPVVVKFGAHWCGPCRMLDPELDILGQNGRTNVVRVDIEKHRELARQYHVSAIPHLFLFQNGNVVAERVGYADHQQLRKWVVANTSP